MSDDNTMYMVAVTVDTNDGDYATGVDDMKKVDLHRFLTLLKRMEGHKPRGERYHPSLKDQWGHMYTEEDMEYITEVCPNGAEDYGFHTIVSVQYAELVGQCGTLHICKRWNGMEDY